MKSDTVKKGIERAPHRSLFKAMGYTDAEMERPLIGIASSANEIIPGHIHLDKIVEAVKAGVYMAGGLPVVFGTIGVCDGIAMNHEGMKFSLASRELIADSVEVMAMAHAFDGLVLVPNCDKIVPGMLMAAARLNIPSVLISGGPMLAGRHPLEPGKKIDLITVFEAVGAVRSGKMDEETLTLMEDAACPTCGSCAGMFTANSMNCLSEAIGMALPGQRDHPCGDGGEDPAGQGDGDEHHEARREADHPKEDHDPGRAHQRPGRGHGPRLFHEHRPPSHGHCPRGRSCTGPEEDQRGEPPHPNLCSLSPGGKDHLEDLDRAGGISAVLKELSSAGLIQGSCMTATGKSVAENIARAQVKDRQVIRPSVAALSGRRRDRGPFRQSGALGLRGETVGSA